MEHSRFTRGTGYQEPFLARQRARQANRFIQGNLRYDEFLILVVDLIRISYRIHISKKNLLSIINQH